MAIERVIGIDFGTSTSVIRIKRYQDGKIIGNQQFVVPVTFNMGSTVVPTLIQKTDTDTYYGFEAQIPHRKSTLYQNFKVDLENEDADIREQARSLTEEFFSYLYREYRTQSDGGHLGESDDYERTIISYPVKWGDETKRFMIDAAKKAGFPHVEGMDEAQAAIHAVTVQNADYLRQKGYFQDKTDLKLLLIDMGAGTTDLVLCQYAPNTAQIDILCTWPVGGDILFGGKDVDVLLQEFVKSMLPADEAATILKRCGIDKFKAWKETVISPSLKKGDTVREFSELDMILELLELDAEDYSISRTVFENMAGEYLTKLPKLVNGCLEAAKLQGQEIDLVILTGGHSQWYFVNEILSGNMEQFGNIPLEKIHQDPGRIIPIALPQETVAVSKKKNKEGTHLISGFVITQ